MSSQATTPSTITPTGPTALQQAVEPYSFVRALKIDRQYKALCAGPPRGQDLGKWFKKWEKFYVELKATNHSDIETGLIVDHFLNSLKQTEPHLAAVALFNLRRKRLMNEQTPTFMETLDLFRQMCADVPGSYVRVLRIDRQYEVLCAGPPRGQDLRQWLDKWEKLYVEAKERKHFGVETGVIIDQFINSFKQTDPALATKALYDLQSKRLRNEQTLTFMETLDIFRQVFAIQGQTPGSSSTSKRSNRQTGNTPPKECVCGKMHWYSDCFYINKPRRPKGWNPNPNIVKKIDEALKDPKVKANVDKAMKKNSRG